MDVAVVSLFPEMFAPFAQCGVLGRAIRGNLARIILVDPRSFTTDVHGTVDDRPYGGGPGMVIRMEPFATAINAARAKVPAGSPVVFLSPQGRPFDQATAVRYAGLPGMVLVAGRYEGFDERLIETLADEEISVGDFVMSGGEVAAMAVVDATLRLRPGVLGDERSAEEESFANGLLDYPHYTRPEIADGRPVPRVLLEGNHAAIRRWRRKQALGRTSLRRPDLLGNRDLSEEDRRLLDEFCAEQ
ncbi:MAG: tRNA (guanosine(37)-N1)-methyltransferase TrmD [Gammaproteobacteria bacterium]|nr:tRNA (guanosine(37)-N1)-methyltransferase TrmD [Gammaproteobacteria bacterium]MDH5276506.1 tRNA (guanosine(37)-N1)-methyltransferase TrmD [Gammaproteobacteria bacterium]